MNRKIHIISMFDPCSSFISQEVSYEWVRSDKSQKLLSNASALEQALVATKPLFTSVRQKRKREEEESRDRSEVMVDSCGLHLIEDTVTCALSFFDMCMMIAESLGPLGFREVAPVSLLALLTNVAVSAVPSVGLPVRQGAFLECSHSVMRTYLDAVHENPDDWNAKAPTSTRFKNSLSKHFTHEALCLPPKVCHVLRRYDIFVAPPIADPTLEVKFFRSTTGRKLASFADATRQVMTLWGPRIEGGVGTSSEKLSCERYRS